MFKKNQLRKALSLFVCLALALSLFAGLTLGEDNPTYAASGDVERLAGDDRYETSAKIADKKFTTPSYAIVTRGDTYADGLAASVLSGALNAPVLLVRSNTLPDTISSRLTALGKPRVIILGGTVAVSTAVENALKDLVGSSYVTRLGGADRFATAALVAAEAAKYATLSRTAFIVNGFASADSLVAGPAAFRDRMPILQVYKDSIPDVTKQAIANRGINKLIIVGGTDVVANSVATALGKLSGVSSVKRVWGSTRYETSVEFAKDQFPYVGNFCLVRGADNNLADAIGATVLGYPILYVEQNSIRTGVNNYLDNRVTSSSEIFVIGGTDAVSNTVRDRARALVSGTAVFNPAQGATNVSTSVQPTISFPRAISNTSGTAITDSNVDSLITFRRGGSSGTSVSFTASIDSGKRVITVYPTSALDTNTTYYLAVDSVSDTSGTISSSSVTWSTGTEKTTTSGLAIQSITALDPQTIKITFNNALGDSARLVASYAVYDHTQSQNLTIDDVSVSTNRKEVKLALGEDLVAGRSYTLNWLNITDTSGKKMSEKYRFWTPDVTSAKPTLSSSNIKVLTNGEGSLPGAFMITLPDRVTADISNGDITLKKVEKDSDTPITILAPTYIKTTTTEPGRLIVKLTGNAQLVKGTYNLEVAQGKLDRFGVTNDAFGFNFSVSTITPRQAKVTGSRLYVKTDKLYYEAAFDYPIYSGSGNIVIKTEDKDNDKTVGVENESDPVMKTSIELGTLANTVGIFKSGKNYSATIPAGAWKTVGSDKTTVKTTRSVAGIDTIAPKVTAIELISAKQTRITFDKEVRLTDKYSFTIGDNKEVKYTGGAATATAAGKTITLNTVDVATANLPTTFVRGSGGGLKLKDDNESITNTLGFPLGGEVSYYLKGSTTGDKDKRLVTDNVGPEVVKAVSDNNKITLNFSEKVVMVAGITEVKVLVKKAGADAAEVTMSIKSGGTTAEIDFSGAAAGDQVTIVANSLKSATDDQLMKAVTVTTK